MSPDDPWEPSGGHRPSWDPSPYDDEDGIAERRRDVRPERRREERPRDDRRDARSAAARSRLQGALRPSPAKGRRVRRTVRHVDPWSVLRLSLLFYAAVFLIVCVASAVLWTGARASGTLDNLEDFVTSVGGFGNCEPVGGAPRATTTTTSTTVAGADDVDQLDPSGSSTTEPEVLEADLLPAAGDDDEDCRAGEELVGGFELEDTRIFAAFAFGGVVLVLAGAGTSVVMVLLFNLMSDLTGGVQVWIVEDEPKRRRPDDAGSPPARRRG